MRYYIISIYPQAGVRVQWTLFGVEWRCGLITRVSHLGREEETREAMRTSRAVEGKRYQSE